MTLEQQKIIQLVARLQKIDAKAVENLQRLTEMAETNKGKYFLALKFL